LKSDKPASRLSIKDAGKIGTLFSRKPVFSIPGEGDSPIKRTGVLVGHFEKNRSEVPKYSFVGVA